MGHLTREFSKTLALCVATIVILSAAFLARGDSYDLSYLHPRLVSVPINPIVPDSTAGHVPAPDIVEVDTAKKRAVPFGYEEALKGSVNASGHSVSERSTKVVPTGSKEFDTSQAKGQKLWDIINNPSAHTETRWLHLDDLTGVDQDGISYGWVEREDELDQWEDYTQSYKTVFPALNIPVDEDSNFYSPMYQTEEFQTCGERRQATGGRFETLVNVPGKTLVAGSNFSPQYNVRKRFKVDRLTPEQALELPQVTSWSDVVWIQWISRFTGVSPAEASALKYIFRYHVVTDISQRVIEGCLGLVEGGFPDPPLGQWPPPDDWTFRPDQAEFMALLGIPHGLGIAFLLSQHPNELGGKSIESITIFTVTTAMTGAKQWHLLYTLTGPGNAAPALRRSVNGTDSEVLEYPRAKL